MQFYAGIRRNNMTILVVDDSIFVRQFMKKYLLEINQNVELNFAASGEEGYEVYSEKHPDLVITDLLMPGMGGQAFIEKIRKTDITTRIVVLSADIQKTVKEEIAALKVTAFLNKPINKESVRFISGLVEG
jgi:two-component system, chemotaxis family, chemotaxis protein CheY